MYNLLKNLRDFYGTWLMRFGEFGSLISLSMSGLTTSWVIQNVFEDSFSMEIPLLYILFTGFVLFCLGAFLMDKLGLIGAREEQLWQKNKYSKSLTGGKK